MINNECVVQRSTEEGLVATGKILQTVLGACELANIKYQLLLYFYVPALAPIIFLGYCAVKAHSANVGEKQAL